MKKIAIIGSGISGLTCAYLLNQKHQIRLFEANDYLGGHTQTTDVDVNGTNYPVNTGFIVFNDWTYPNFIKLMDKLDVANEASDMSFSVKSETNGMEYNGHTLDTLFAQRRNALNPKFLMMIRDILRFNKETCAELKNDSIDKEETLSHYLQRNRYGEYFKRYYIIPMGAAIWSSSEEMMMDFPVYFFLRFFNNHGMLSVSERPQWRVISNGSRSYVEKIVDKLTTEGEQDDQKIRLNTPVTRVERHEDSVTVHSQYGAEVFDEVIFACHSDQALAMLDQPSADEKRILTALPYQNNEVVLHTDESILPVSKKAWASWNYHVGQKSQDTVAVTYYMNRLQNFDHCPKHFCVTLNKTQDIDEKKIINTFNYAHPVFTLDGMQAQASHHQINNQHRTHFCGAYWFNGFHEDGVRSALRVLESFGVSL